MRHWKGSLITAVVVVLVLSLPVAMAADYTWNYAGNSVWSDPSKWAPLGGPPSGQFDRAFVGTLHPNSQVWLDANESVGYLYITNTYGGYNRVWNNGHRLLVYNTAGTAQTVLTELPGGGSVRLLIDRGILSNDFDTDILDINGGAELYMDGGIAQIDDYLDVDSSSYITGYGTIEFSKSTAAGSRVFYLDGTLQTNHATNSLTLRVTGDGKLDLDGNAGNGVIDVTTGTSSLVIDGAVADAFNGMMTIGEGNSVDFTQAWTHSGTLNFNGVSGTATLSGATVTVNQDINVNSGTGRITAPVIFNTGTDVVVAGSLNLNGATTTYNGGSYTGAGTLSQNYDAIVAADTSIDVAIFNWDGHLVSGTTTINSGVTFTINSDKIDELAPATDGYDGTVTVNGGTLAVNTDDPWRMEGTMNLNSAVGTPNVNGQEMVVGNTSGTAWLNATNGASNINCPVKFESTAEVAVNSNGVLYLKGQTTYGGGNFSGTGIIRQQSNATVTGNTTMGVDLYEWDGASSSRTFTIDSGAWFTINSDTISYSPATDGYDSTININGSGRLYVNTADPWAMEGTMNLNFTGVCCPGVYGTEMIVRDSAIGEGINATGTSNSTIHCPVTFESTARVNVDGGAGLGFFDPITFKGGNYTGDGRIYMMCDMNVEANTTIDVAEIDLYNIVAPVHTITIDPDVTFTINSSINNFGSGIIDINGGKFVANSPGGWTLGAYSVATMNINSATNWGELHGTEMTLDSSNTLNLNDGVVYAPIIVEGTVNANIHGWFYGATVFESTANVSIPTGWIVLEGPTIFRGGSYTGAGTLYQWTDVAVEDHTTIDTDTYDWDGNYTTRIDPGITFRINSTTINKDVGKNDFGGTLNINSGTLYVNTADPWAMEGTMNLNNTGIIPTVYGTEMIVRDSAVGEGINVTGGAGWINCPVTFESTARIHVDTGASLELRGPTIFQGGEYTGGGMLRQYGDTVVEADTTIDTATYDWDMNSTTDTTVNSGVTFTINSAINDAHDGVVNVNTGHLIVNSPWTMAGTINLVGGGNVLDGERMTLAPGGTLSSSGTPLVYAPVTVEGTVTISPSVAFFGDTIFESTAMVNLVSGEYINLYGPTTYRGGTFTGGMIRQNGDATVESDTTISASVFDWDGYYENSVTTINSGVTFTLDINEYEYTPGGKYNGTTNIHSGATLAVNTPSDWMMEGQMNLAGGQVTGSEIINDGTISGYGTISSDLTNNGLASFNGGTSDVYGTVSNSGNIDVTDYTTTFHGNVKNAVTGAIKNTNGRIVFNANFINDGSYVSDPADNYFNNIDVGTTGYFVGGAGDRFFVNGNFVNFSTANTSWETSAAELTFHGGSTNYFYLTGADLGLNTAGYTDNFAWGTLSLDWGQWLDLHDGNGTLGGAVYVEDLLFDAGTKITLNGLNIYYRNGGNLKQFFCGDATLDGYVDGGDLDILLADWGTGVPPANYRADLSGDFFVDGDDLDIILADWGKGVPPPVPEPVSATLLLLGAAAMLKRRRK